MDGRHVVVTLTPVYAPDTLPFRSLTFASDNDTAPIGRASKSETKNLVPAHDNGWFDSRVMSREHAVISVSLEMEAIYIRDHGSMHGTLVNDKKITAKENVPVKNGDVLTFGSEVSRGPQTFRPIAVRFDCNWYDSKPAYLTPAEPSKTPTNTFRVPDDDDDVIVVVEDSSESAGSTDADYGSDVSRPVDLTSPVTSPEAKHSELPRAKPIRVDATAGSQQESLIFGQEEQIPPSSPLDIYRTDVLEFDDTDSQPDSDNDSNNGSGSAWIPPNDEDMQDVEESDVDEEDIPKMMGMDQDDVPLTSSQQALSSAHDANLPSSPIPRRAIEEPVKKMAQTNTPSFIPPGSALYCPAPTLTPVIRPPALFQTEPSNLVATSANNQGQWSHFHSPRIPSPSDKAMAKSSGNSVPNYQSSFQDFTSNMDCLYDLHEPPAPVCQEARSSLLNQYVPNAANESFPFGPHRSSGYLRHLSDEGNGIAQPQSTFDNTDPHLLFTYKSKPGSSNEAQKSTEPTPTRVSIEDILEKTSGQSVLRCSLKRKADELETDQPKETEKEREPNTQDSLPDAQPQVNLKDLVISDPKVVNATNQHSGRNREHRRKRVKTRQPGNVIKYATAAMVGAVVGGISTVVALAALPPGFFE